MKENLTFLGIETSCDETAASVVREKKDGTGKILSNIVSSQIEEHKEFGGVVPEIAARAHVEKIEFIIKKAIKESNLNFNSIDGITHAFRSKEYELRNELYYAILDALNMRKPKMLEFSRLEFKGMPVSKRIIRPLMEKGKVSSLDDPRLPTLAALLRRGITPEAIRKFTKSLGFTKADTLAPFDSLEAFNRTIIDKTSIRLFMVREPKILTINNLPNSVIELPNHPSNDLGTRQVKIENGVLLSSEDVKELEVGSQLRLMGLGNIKITSIKSEITGEFTGDDHNVNFRKVQWVSQKTAHKLKILIPHQLFIDDEFNEGSLEEVHAYTEPHYLELKEGAEIQFVRFGYCRKDSANQAIYTHK